MKGSISQVWIAEPKIHGTVSYRTLRRHIAFPQNNILGIGGARMQTDLCPVCQLWDHVVSKRVETDITDLLLSLELACHNYFQKFALKDKVNS